MKSIKCPRMILLKDLLKSRSSVLILAVITDKKWYPEKNGVTLDYQQVNKDVYMSPFLRLKNSGTSYMGMIASSCLTLETASNNLKLKKQQGNCSHFALPGEYFAIKEWLWEQAQPAARYTSASEK